MNFSADQRIFNSVTLGIVLTPILLMLFSLNNLFVNCLILGTIIFLTLTKGTLFLVFIFSTLLLAPCKGIHDSLIRFEPSLIKTPIGNFEFVELWIIIIFLAYTYSKGIRKDFRFLLLILVFLGGGIASQHALIQGSSAWSASLRAPVVLLGFFISGFFGKKKFFSNIPLLFSYSVAIVYFLYVLLSLKGHIFFLVPIAIAVFFIYRRFIIGITVLVFFLLFQGFFTFTLVFTLLFALLFVIGYLFLNHKFFLLKKKFIRVIIVFSSIFFMSNMFNFYNYAVENDQINSQIKSFDSLKNYAVFKIIDRVQFWVPFWNKFSESPLIPHAGEKVNVMILTGEIRHRANDIGWNIHPHNVFISLLYDYGAVFGTVFIFLILSFWFQAFGILSSVCTPMQFSSGLICVTSLPGILFGFYPLEAGIGAYFWIFAGLSVFIDKSKKLIK